MAAEYGERGSSRSVSGEWPLLDGAVDLVGRDLEEAERAASAAGARLADGLEQDVDADHAGPEERLGIEDAPVDVRLRREVDDRVGVGDERPDHVGIGDVALDEPEPRCLRRVGLDLGQVGPVARRRSACRGP